jgi:hypothetical protein
MEGYSRSEVALSLMPVPPPDQVLALLEEERLRHLVSGAREPGCPLAHADVERLTRQARGMGHGAGEGDGGREAIYRPGPGTLSRQ